MDIWEYDLEQAKNNLKSANILHEKGFISISAFHAQQSVELGIKAIALKFGFEQYLGKKHKFKNSHIPARGLTSEIYEFVTESLKSLDISHFDEKMNENISKSMLDVKEIIKIFNEIDNNKNGKKFEEIWKHSLGIDSSEKIITALESYKKSCSTELSKELCTGVSELSRKVVLDLENFARKNHQRLQFKEAIKRVKEIFPEYGLSEKFVDAFLEDKEEYEKMIKELIEKHGTVGTMDFLLGPKGFLNVFSDSRLPSKILEKWNIMKRINFIWITYLVTISPTTVLLFPHVIIGRYPRWIDLNRNSEDIYRENSSKVKELIDEADRTLKRIEQILTI